MRDHFQIIFCVEMFVWQAGKYLIWVTNQICYVITLQVQNLIIQYVLHLHIHQCLWLEFIEVNYSADMVEFKFIIRYNALVLINSL